MIVPPKKPKPPSPFTWKDPPTALRHCARCGFAMPALHRTGHCPNCGHALDRDDREIPGPRPQL